MFDGITEQNRCLFGLMACYITVYIAANLFDARLINLHGWTIGGGAIIFSFTYLISEIITEVYGYKFARLIIWLGFVFNLLILCCGLGIYFLPHTEGGAPLVKQFNLIQGSGARIVLSSILCYLAIEPLGAFAMVKLKYWLQGRFIFLRFMLVALIINFVGAWLFCLLAFFKTMPNADFVQFTLSSFLVMFVLQVFFLLLVVPLAKYIKRIEKMDRYDDVSTKFNLFSLDTRYQRETNHF